MVFRLSIFLVSLILCLSMPLLAQTDIIHSDAQQYLEFLREEQAELDFQVRHGEITHPFYTRATNRLKILRDLIIVYGHDSQKDKMPEYHVVLAQELETLISDGFNKIKKAKPNQVIDDNWRFVKTITRGETFYILERLNNN